MLATSLKERSKVGTDAFDDLACTEAGDAVDTEAVTEGIVIKEVGVMLI